MLDRKVEVVQAEYNEVAAIFIGALMKYKVFNAVFILTFAVLSVVFALSIPNQYRSVALLTSSESSSGGISSMLGQLGGVASLAGINIGSGSEKSVFHLEEKIKSRDFLIPFINKENIKVELFSAQSWDRATNNLLYDETIYNIEEQKWVREVELPKKAEPSDEEAYRKFRDVFKVTYDRKKDLFKLSIDFYSPELAQQWLSNLIDEFNEYERASQIAEVHRNLKFLNTYINEAEYIELKSSLYDLIEEQLKKMMVSESKDDFAIEVIQGAFIPEEKESPRRGLICIGITMLGIFISIMVSIFMFIRTRNK